jgi:predicted alpha/beta hydrolase
MLARFDFNVRSMVFFASKRRISVVHAKRIFMVDMVWTLAGTTLAALFGYLPARHIKIGSDNEPRRFFMQTNRWVYSRKWIDPADGFDYGEALQKKMMPPTLFLSGINDHVLGNPVDVELLMSEMPNPLHEFQILGKNYGNAHNYGHIDILTHHRAAEDHFPICADWFRQFGGNS